MPTTPTRQPFANLDQDLVHEVPRSVEEAETCDPIVAWYHFKHLQQAVGGWHPDDPANDVITRNPDGDGFVRIFTDEEAAIVEVVTTIAWQYAFEHGIDVHEVALRILDDEEVEA